MARVDDDLHQQIELFFACRNLPNLDTFSKTDAFVVIERKLVSGGYEEVGRTGTVWDSLDPDFPDQIIVDYFFEEVQEFRLRVFDRDSATEDLSYHDFAGEATMRLGGLMGTRGATLRLPLRLPDNPSKDRGTIIIRGEEVKAGNDVVRLGIAAKKLKKMGWISGPHPFYTVTRAREDGEEMQVYRSPHMKHTTADPVWNTVDIPVQRLCNGDHDRPLTFTFYDYTSSGAHKIIGCVQTSLRDLGEVSERPLAKQVGVPSKSDVGDGALADLLSLLFCSAQSPPPPPPAGGMGGGGAAVGRAAAPDPHDSRGHMRVTSCEVVRQASLLEYIAGGCEINLMVAIDFTASNGAPSTPTSLHYRDPSGRPNQYEAAIRAVGSVLQEYDSDKKYPVYGFGGRMVGAQVSHCFPLSFDPQNPEVEGVEGIVQAYRNSLDCVSLAGPTLFSPLLRSVIETASQHVSQRNQQYWTLLILTDGVINDMDATVDAIVHASSLPLSIVIVGVGNADFDAMEVLDADEVPLRDRSGKVMERDIVQFVPFRKYQNQHYSRLAKDTMVEIPGQLLSFMKSKGIAPNPPLAAVGGGSSRQLLQAVQGNSIRDLNAAMGQSSRALDLSGGGGGGGSVRGGSGDLHHGFPVGSAPGGGYNNFMPVSMSMPPAYSAGGHGGSVAGGGGMHAMHAAPPVAPVATQPAYYQQQAHNVQMAPSSLPAAPLANAPPPAPQQPKAQERPECVICMSEPRNATCVPCGHMAGCMGCLTTLQERQTGCPVCRQPISSVMRIYAS